MSLLAVLALPTAVLAAALTGTPGADALTGTAEADTIHGLAGNDTTGRAATLAPLRGRARRGGPSKSSQSTRPPAAELRS